MTFSFRAQRITLPDGRRSATVLGPQGTISAVEDYFTFLDAIGRSPNTVRGYASDLAQWFEFLDARSRPWDQATMDDLGDFTAHLRRTNRAVPETNVVVLRPQVQKRSPASVQRALSAVFAFYDHHWNTPIAQALARSRQGRTAVRKGRYATGKRPIQVIVPDTIPDILTQDQAAVIVNAASTLRDRLLLLMMLLNGLRVGAALGLRHEDINVRKKSLTIRPRDDNANGARAKRRSDLTLPLHPAVGRIYTDYLDIEYGDLDSDYVFVNLWAGQIGAPMTYSNVRQLISRLSRATGVTFTAHTLRHTFATEARRGGAQLEAVSELLGHASVDVTRSTYIHTTVEDLRKELDRVEQSRRGPVHG